MNPISYNIDLFATPPKALLDSLSILESDNGFESLIVSWSELTRDSNPRRVELCWLVISQENVLRAVGVVHIIHKLAVGDYVDGPLKKITEFGRRIGYAPLSVDVAFLEIPFTNRSGLVFHADVSLEERTLITKTVIEYLDRELSVDAICVKDIKSNYVLDYKKSNTIVLPFVELNILKLNGESPTFEQWLAERSPNYRSTIRRNLRTFQKSGAIIETIIDPAPYSQCLADLYNRTATKALMRGDLPYPMAVNSCFFENFHAKMTDRGIIRIVRIENTIVGFTTLLFGHDTLFFRFIGLDYELSPQSRTYFRLLYDTIEIAISKGLRFIDMGSGTSHVKAPLGCEQIPTVYYVHFRRFLKPVSRLMNFWLSDRFDNTFSSSETVS
uniref:BioF2-like acetyltransferase domain-containing protein n=1 Tax=Cyanothece sp. (strain PCC 7425 / ATCC 29141) TaxID=395961 RepID=B8HL96_CYAP4